MAQGRVRTFGLLGLVAVSTPLTLALESLLRRWLFPSNFEEFRTFVQPIVTPWVWVGPLVVLATLPLAHRLQRTHHRRQLARPVPYGRTEAEWRRKAAFEALMISTSVPQVPAIAATVAFMIGSDWPPVLATVGVATLCVLSLGFTAPPQASA